MRFEVFVIVFVLVFHPGHGAGFFSKFTNRGRNGNNQASDFVDVCETVRIMPRIAMAVVGGAPLKNENSAPYIAAVGERTSNGSISWFCGGSLVSPHHILTAAHCLVSRNVSTVRLGSFSTKTRTTENDYEVSETVIHPAYKITESYNDIGILKIKDRISLDSNIKPVCLPQNNEKYEKERAKVIGWGAEEFGGEGTQKLQQVDVDVYTNDNCEKAYRNSTIAPKTFPNGIKSEQLCAGSKKGGKDACQGDSGGPLVLTDEQGIVRQIGIVSTGAGCGFKMYPGVYTRVSSYTDWIKQQIKNHDPVQSNQKNHSQKEDSHRKDNPPSRPHETSTEPTQNGTLLSFQSYNDNHYNNKTKKGSQSTEKNHVPQPSQKNQSSKESSNGKNNSSKLQETSTKSQRHDTHLSSHSDNLHTKLTKGMPRSPEKGHSSKSQNQHYNENFSDGNSYTEVLENQNNKISGTNLNVISSNRKPSRDSREKEHPEKVVENRRVETSNQTNLQNQYLRV